MANLIIFLVCLLPLAAAGEPAAPQARLVINSLAVAGRVSTELLDPASPSCDLLKQRVAYAKKQVEEFRELVAAAIKAHKKIDPGTQSELDALEKRWLSIHADLTRPWAMMSSEFALGDLGSAHAVELASGDYRVTADVLGRHWEALKAELPDGWDLSFDSTVNALNFRMNMNSMEYCFGAGGILLRVDLAAISF